MKVLQLTLKKKWFDMIASGEKKEEYREIKKYWGDRLCNNGKQWLDGFKEFDAVLFINGYSPNSPRVLVSCESIDFGNGNPDWGAVEGVEYFVITLGDIIKPETTGNQTAC